MYICIISIGTIQIGFLQNSNNNSFEEKTQQAGINLEYLKQQQSISRYEVTRLLNAVECIDCINPGNSIISTYTNNFWGNFKSLPGKDFNDIYYKKAVYNNKSYYYCVASVADKEYMFGYPTLTSPLCPGEFCGTNTMTKGEFIQVITNILSKYIQKNYTTDWKQIKIRYDSLAKGSYSYNIFNEKDKSIIINKAQQCEENNCTLGGSAEFHTYLKYCMFNIETCNMQELGRITQGYWPIAELNIAIKEGIITNNKSFINTIHKPIDGKTAVEAFGKVFSKIQCDFNTDYDCDGIPNHLDNCPNHYNPSQKDTDGDKFGDVCDDDIDSDGIKNPIGIVDERGSINIALRTLQTDNCLFIQNNNQIDSNTNYQGDSCDLSTIKGVSIGTKIIGSGEDSKVYAYVVADYSPIENERVRNIEGKTFYGKDIFYPITKSGQHTFYLQSQRNQRRKASASIITTYNKGYTNVNLSLGLSKAYLPTILTAKVITAGTPKEILRTLEGPENQTKTNFNSQENVFLIRKEGNYLVTATIKNNKNETIGISSRSFIIEKESNKIDNIVINNSNPNIGEIFTVNISNSIKERKIDWGDDTSSIETKNTINHSYRKDGVYIVRSTLTLNDNNIINDYKTIVVSKKEIDNNRVLFTEPFALENITGLPITLNTVRIGYNKNDILSTMFYDGIIFSTGDVNSLGGYKKGIYYPEKKEVLGLCQYVTHQSTVVINDNNILSCLNMRTNNIKPECDMDGDHIDDRCDDDIDGDGIRNPIGLIIKNDPSCDINKAIIDKDKRDSMINQLQGKQFNNICKSLDNCPLQSNIEQVDTNRNGIGDACENAQYNFSNNMNSLTNGNNNESNNINNDNDSDGIPNSNDICPDTKETYNGYQDTDGCPELGDSNPCDSQVLGDTFINFECLQCPCQYAQESSDIIPGDIIRATLRNISGSILQSRSNTKTL